MIEALCNGYQSLSPDSPLSCVPHHHPQGHSSSHWASGQKGFFLHSFISSSMKPLNYSSLTSGTSDPRIPCKSSPVPYPPFPPLCLPQERNLSVFSQPEDYFEIGARSFWPFGNLSSRPGWILLARKRLSTPGGYLWIGGSRAQDSGGQATLLGGVVGWGVPEILTILLD